MKYSYKENRENILSHLSKYKKNILKITKNGIYIKEKREYSHILPKEIEIKNIIYSEYLMDLWDYVKRSNLKLHNDFHHLNSSQAFCFNLFYPIIMENELRMLLNTYEKITDWDFEYIPDKIEKTNFDVFIKTKENNYYFEIKYLENNFPKQEVKDRKIERYHEIYENKLSIFKNVTPDVFFDNYQIFRNLSYIHKGIINFVFPKTRLDLDIQLKTILEKYCDKVLLEKINIIYVEDILSRVSNNKKLIEYYKLFSEKYMDWTKANCV